MACDIWLGHTISFASHIELALPTIILLPLLTILPAFCVTYYLSKNIKFNAVKAIRLQMVFLSCIIKLILIYTADLFNLITGDIPTETLTAVYAISTISFWMGVIIAVWLSQYIAYLFSELIISYRCNP